MAIPNRNIMYKQYQDGVITEKEYRFYLMEQEEREKEISERFEQTVRKLTNQEERKHDKN